MLPVRGCPKTYPILLANPLQSSKRTFSWGSFLSFFAFFEGMWDTQIAALLSSPTVSYPLWDMTRDWMPKRASVAKPEAV
jgi:hypothetical protein